MLVANALEQGVLAPLRFQVTVAPRLLVDHLLYDVRVNDCLLTTCV